MNEFLEVRPNKKKRRLPIFDEGVVCLAPALSKAKMQQLEGRQ